MPSSPKKILIVCSHFWPSVGGLESMMGQISSELTAAGYGVSVMTLDFPGRTSNEHQGVSIISVAQPEFQVAIRSAVASGEFDACLLAQDPLGPIVWSVEGLDIPARTRLLIQPIINEDGFTRWKANADFRQRLARILKQPAAAALVMTQSGPDVRYMREEGIDYSYLPNATTPSPAAGNFRAQFGIAPDKFLVLHVANVFWVKNHIGLIDALPDMPESWQVVMIGSQSGSRDCVEAVQDKLSTRPEIKFIPGLPKEWVAAAMQAADVVVLASHGEGSPVTILEAMSHRKPWLATPTCGAANDHVGGIIAELKDFKSCLQILAADIDLRQQLAALSFAHWQQSYSWPVVIRGWTELIEYGGLRACFELPQALRDDMAHVRSAFLAKLAELAPRQRPAIGLVFDEPSAAAAKALNEWLGAEFTLEFMRAGDESALRDFAGRALVDFSEKGVPAPAGLPLLIPSLGVDALSNPTSRVPTLHADLAAYGGDHWRTGPIAYGWIGDVKTTADVQEILIPTMGDEFQVAIADDTKMNDAQMAHFLGAIDVLIVTSDSLQNRQRVMRALACGVFPVAVRASRMALLIEEGGFEGRLIERTAQAFKEALRWCASHEAELRRGGARNARASERGLGFQRTMTALRQTLRRIVRTNPSAGPARSS